MGLQLESWILTQVPLVKKSGFESPAESLYAGPENHPELPLRLLLHCHLLPSVLPLVHDYYHHHTFHFVTQAVSARDDVVQRAEAEDKVRVVL